jgi:hypothetical protein
VGGPAVVVTLAGTGDPVRYRPLGDTSIVAGVPARGISQSG